MADPRQRSLKIRRKPAMHPDGGLSMEAVAHMIELKVKEEIDPLKAQIVALQSNAINLKVILTDLYNTATIAAADNSSTKTKLIGLVENLAAALGNVETLIGPDGRRQSGSHVVDMDQMLAEAAVELGIGDDGDDGDIYDEPGDDLVANVSEETDEEVDDMRRGRGRPLRGRTRRRYRE